jgi:hypothetical protein
MYILQSKNFDFFLQYIDFIDCDDKIAVEVNENIPLCHVGLRQLVIIRSFE